MPLSLPRRKPANRQAPLKRHLPRPRERHPVHGAVVGHITDLETIVCRRVNGRRAFRRNDVIDQQSRSQTEPIPAATRNVHLDNATSGATFTRTVQPSLGQDTKRSGESREGCEGRVHRKSVWKCHRSHGHNPVRCSAASVSAPRRRGAEPRRAARYRAVMASTVNALFDAARVVRLDAVPWRVRVPTEAQGVYVVARTADPSELVFGPAAIDGAAVQQLLHTRAELLVDGRRPSREVLSQRLASMWLPDGSVVYVGLARSSLNIGA